MFTDSRMFVFICVQQCVGEGVGLCSQHNLHRKDYIQIYKQRNADLNTRLNFFQLKVLLQFFAKKIGYKVTAILLRLRSRNCLRAALAGEN